MGKKYSKKKSRQGEDHRVLGVITPLQIESVLLGSVNLPNPIDYPDNRPEFERWFERWKWMFTFRGEDQYGKSKALEMPREQLEIFAPAFRTTLRRLWQEQDLRQRDWYLYRLRDIYHQLILTLENPGSFEYGSKESTLLRRLTDRLFQDVPRVSPFEAAIFWLQANQSRMLYCQNPMCETPYFFRTKKGQKFCSPECANPVRKESKRRWWVENRGKTAKVSLKLRGRATAGRAV